MMNENTHTHTLKNYSQIKQNLISENKVALSQRSTPTLTQISLKLFVRNYLCLGINLIKNMTNNRKPPEGNRDV